jgi:hypothetical protein
MEKRTKLFLFQLDHVAGDDIGSLIETLFGWGAADVQVLSTIIRQNHPAYLVLVDIGSLKEASFAADLAFEFGVSAYHRLETQHNQLPVRQIERELTVRCNGGELKMALHVRQIGEARPAPAPPPPALALLTAMAPPEVLEPPGSQNFTVPLNSRVEAQDIRKLKDQIQQTFGVRISLASLQQRVEILLSSGAALVLELSKPKK